MSGFGGLLDMLLSIDPGESFKKTIYEKARRPVLEKRLKPIFSKYGVVSPCYISSSPKEVIVVPRKNYKGAFGVVLSNEEIIADIYVALSNAEKKDEGEKESEEKKDDIQYLLVIDENHGMFERWVRCVKVRENEFTFKTGSGFLLRGRLRDSGTINDFLYYNVENCFIRRNQDSDLCFLGNLRDNPFLSDG